MKASLVRFSILPALLLLLASCAQRPVMTSGSGGPPAPAVAAPASAETPSSSRASEAGLARVSAVPDPKEFTSVKDLKPIHFDFDKYDVRPRDAKILDAHASWMKANSNYLVLIEGHADERGTNEYNLALAERRAKATLNYLVAQGVAAARMSLIGYGEERPVCNEKHEACWARNRRAQSLVKAQ